MPEIFDDSSKQPVPVQDIYNAYEVARLLGISKNKVWELSKRGNDPLPLRRMEGQKKGSIAFRIELLDWAMRNFSTGPCATSRKSASGRRRPCMRREIPRARATATPSWSCTPSCGRSSGSRARRCSCSRASTDSARTAGRSTRAAGGPQPISACPSAPSSGRCQSWSREGLSPRPEANGQGTG